MRDYDIESDLKQEKFQSIKLVQGDRGNKIKINVYEDGQPVSLTGCSISAKYKRADGEVVDGTVENKTDNYFYAVMNSNITKVAGTLKMLFSIEKDDVKVSTFLLFADVREGIGENTGSSGGDTEVTVDLEDYQKKMDNGLETKNKYIVGAINEVNSQCKDIATKTITTDERNKLTNLENYDDSSIKNDIQSVQQQVNNLVLGAVGDGNNAEVVQARGNCSVLNERLNVFDNKIGDVEYIYVDDLTLQSPTVGTITYTSYNFKKNNKYKIIVESDSITNKTYTAFLNNTQSTDGLFSVIKNKYTEKYSMEFIPDKNYKYLGFYVDSGKNVNLVKIQTSKDVSISDTINNIKNNLRQLDTKINNKDKIDFSYKKQSELTIENMKYFLPRLECFLKVGYLGDSLSSGECVVGKNGSNQYVDFYEYSCGKFLQRMTGCEYINFSKGGLTTRTWLSSTYSNQCYNTDNLCNAYIIALGTNDLHDDSLPLGSSTDIDIKNYNNNKDSYYGNYAKIIQKIQEINPNAKIFLLTTYLCYSSDLDAKYNGAIRYMETIFNNVYVADLYKFADLFRVGTDGIINHNLRHGHYNAIAYKYKSLIIGNLIENIMENRPEEFDYIEITGTNYTKNID